MSSEEFDHLPSFAFGDSPELADSLLELVLNGTKTATCGDLHSYEKDGEPLPQPGDQYLILDGKGQAACVIEMVTVDVRQFNEIDEVWAVLEGEGDLSLEFWQEGHREFFERNGVYAPDMKLVCEYFQLVKIFKRDQAKPKPN
ncbi:ASCH domain-containing protein [Pseudovibrio brasiliensis]|uniref:ASCH domain-containing protein n=1 Tax=Pseudovibrio brasiliensis TaxID=1898042 RepID=A0ABX8AHY7_9HYPH|nr:ASCH domain-containing protein [Pseudovibrio brasiliensis]QUS54634.1 ASCH domain-containing protein [Pseudovibrio brasiliensis]